MMRQAKYFPDLFRSKYPVLRGQDWIKALEPEDLRVFVDIGLQAADHGRQGGEAIVQKRGREHMSKIGRIGAIMTNIRKAWNRAVREETERELGVTWDF